MANENVLERKSVKLTLRDNKEYIVQPLPLDDLINLWPIITRLEKKNDNVTVERLNDIKKLAYVALKATNNDIEEKNIGKLVDLVDIQKIMGVIVGQRDLKKL